MQRLKWKICGLKFRENVFSVLKAEPDYLGFIFYPHSSRYVQPSSVSPWISELPLFVRPVAVMVNPTLQEVLHIHQTTGIRMFQLHGQESPEFCLLIHRYHLDVIKAFSVSDDFSFSRLEPYLGKVDYFLFDSKGSLPGGNGFAFNHALLKHYPFDVPYFLGGGVSADMIGEILSLQLPGLFALDTNSRLEIAPGRKDPDKVMDFRYRLNMESQSRRNP